MNCSFLLIMALLFQIVYTEEFSDDSEQGIERENLACAGDCSIPRVDTSPSKQKSTHIAQDAALEASAAREAQNTAGAQAAHQIKLQLAERAEEAAKTAEAAYLAKQGIVEELEQELREAREVAQEEQENLRDERRTLEAAMKAAQEAQHELKLLQESVQLSELNVINAIQAAKGAQAAVEDKEKLLDAAKVKIEEIVRELKIAEEELSATRSAAERAIAAAKEAKINAEKTRKRSPKSPKQEVKLVVTQPPDAESKHSVVRSLVTSTTSNKLSSSIASTPNEGSKPSGVNRNVLSSTTSNKLCSSITSPHQIKWTTAKPLHQKILPTNPCLDKLLVANKLSDNIKQQKEEARKQLMILEEDKLVLHAELEQAIRNASQKLKKPNINIFKRK